LWKIYIKGKKSSQAKQVISFKSRLSKSLLENFTSTSPFHLQLTYFPQFACFL